MSLRRRAPLRPVSAQTPQHVGPAARRAISLAPELVLRGRRLPSAQDAAFATFSRPSGVPRRRGGIDLDDAQWRNTAANGAAIAALWREPSNGCPLAAVVAQNLCGEPVL